MESPVKEKKKHRSRDDKERKRKRHSHAEPEEPTKKPRITDSPQILPSFSTETSATNSPFHQVITSLFLALSPEYSFNPSKNSKDAKTAFDLTPLNGVRKHHLDPLLTKYYEPVGGVVVAYRNIRFETPTARIIAECPFAHIWVTVDFLVYKPQRGMVLEGWVNLQSASHIGLLLENTWNVSIPVVKIPDGWKYHEDRGVFVSAYPQPPKVGEEEDAAAVEGGWMDDKGNYVDGWMKFQVESVKGGRSIFLVGGTLLDQDAIQKAPSSRVNAAKSTKTR